MDIIKRRRLEVATPESFTSSVPADVVAFQGRIVSIGARWSFDDANPVPTGDLVGGSQFPAQDPIAWTSTNGVEWQEAILDAPEGTVRSIAAGPDRIVAVGVNENGFYALASTDGIGWTATGQQSEVGSPTDVASRGGGFALIARQGLDGSGPATAWATDDGNVWVPVGEVPNDVAFTGLNADITIIALGTTPSLEAPNRRAVVLFQDLTIRALETLSTAHMGWYRNDPAGQYKTKVAEFMSTFARGLPEEHGITMEVSVDGQSWYAWRRTVSGWGSQFVP